MIKEYFVVVKYASYGTRSFYSGTMNPSREGGDEVHSFFENIMMARRHDSYKSAQETILVIAEKDSSYSIEKLSCI